MFYKQETTISINTQYEEQLWKILNHFSDKTIAILQYMLLNRNLLLGEVMIISNLLKGKIII